MAELARHYGLPVFGTGGATDSKLIDAQAGTEYAGSLLVAALAGANLIHDVGYLDSGLAGSLESLVLAAEQIRWVKQFVDGLEMSPEALALEAIDEVGPAGDFMGHDHTLEHFRQQMWTPYVVTRASYEDWAEAGALDYRARARHYAKQLVESHQPLPLDASLNRQLRELCGLVDDSGV
jgi:trimethylamine--corrinoid protein Co-methyltransferase